MRGVWVAAREERGARGGADGKLHVVLLKGGCGAGKGVNAGRNCRAAKGAVLWAQVVHGYEEDVGEGQRSQGGEEGGQQQQRLESLFGVHEFSDFCVRSETVRNQLFGVNEKRSE